MCAGIDSEHAEADSLNSDERTAKDQSTALRKQLEHLRRDLAVAQEQQDHRMAGRFGVLCHFCYHSHLPSSALLDQALETIIKLQRPPPQS